MPFDFDERGEVHSMIQNIPDGVDSKFRLVLLIARRAEQLMRGARPKIEADRPMKPTRLAAEEFEDNRVRWDYGAEGGILEEADADGERADETETEAAEEEAAV
jgi:DNA-directed RNA polymerase omega subunit